MSRVSCKVDRCLIIAKVEKEKMSLKINFFIDPADLSVSAIILSPPNASGSIGKFIGYVGRTGNALNIRRAGLMADVSRVSCKVDRCLIIAKVEKE